MVSKDETLDLTSPDYGDGLSYRDSAFSDYDCSTRLSAKEGGYLVVTVVDFDLNMHRTKPDTMRLRRTDHNKNLFSFQPEVKHPSQIIALTSNITVRFNVFVSD